MNILTNIYECVKFGADPNENLKLSDLNVVFIGEGYLYFLLILHGLVESKGELRHMNWNTQRTGL